MSINAEDRWAVAELLARYAELMDRGDFAGVGELLAHASVATEDGTVVAVGSDQIRALYESTTRRHDDGTPRTAHVITNVIVDEIPDGSGELSVRSRFSVFQGTDRLRLQPVVVGRYVDRIRRIDGEWRFVARTMVPEHWGDVAEHLTFDPSGPTSPSPSS